MAEPAKSKVPNIQRKPAECSVNSKDEDPVNPAGRPVAQAPRREEIDETYSSKADGGGPDDTYMKINALQEALNNALAVTPVRYSGKNRRPPFPNFDHKILREPFQALQKIQSEINTLLISYQKSLFAEQTDFLQRASSLFDARYRLIYNEQVYPSRSSLSQSSITLQSASRIYGPWMGFWLNVLEAHPRLRLTIFPHDRLPLTYLMDVRCLHQPGTYSFALEFHFAENPIFQDRVLRKSYTYVLPNSNVRDKNVALSLTPRFCKGCMINWKSKKKLRTSTPTFFNFFDPVVTESQQWISGNLSPKIQRQAKRAFQLEFVLGKIYRTEIIPHASKRFESHIDHQESHPEIKSILADLDVPYSAEDLEALQQFHGEPCSKKPASRKVEFGSKTKHLRDAPGKNSEVNRHVRIALRRLGYRVRQGRAYRQGDLTTSGESSSDTSVPSEEDKEQKGIKKSFRGLLETGTVLQQRKHRGIRLRELRKTADQSDSGDDVASLFDLQSDSGDSCDSETSQLGALGSEEKASWSHKSGNKKKKAATRA